MFINFNIFITLQNNFIFMPLRVT